MPVRRIMRKLTLRLTDRQLSIILDALIERGRSSNLARAIAGELGLEGRAFDVKEAWESEPATKFLR